MSGHKAVTQLNATGYQQGRPGTKGLNGGLERTCRAGGALVLGGKSRTNPVKWMEQIGRPIERGEKGDRKTVELSVLLHLPDSNHLTGNRILIYRFILGNLDPSHQKKKHSGFVLIYR